jgi:hypothetical protein
LQNFVDDFFEELQMGNNSGDATTADPMLNVHPV